MKKTADFTIGGFGLGNLNQFIQLHQPFLLLRLHDALAIVHGGGDGKISQYRLELNGPRLRFLTDHVNRPFCP